MSWLFSLERKRKRDAQHDRTAQRAVAGARSHYHRAKRPRRMGPLKGRELRAAYSSSRPSAAAAARSLLWGTGAGIGGVPRLGSGAATAAADDDAAAATSASPTLKLVAGAAASSADVDAAARADAAATDGPSAEDGTKEGAAAADAIVSVGAEAEADAKGEGAEDDRRRRRLRVAVDSLTLEAMRIEAASLPLPESLHSLALALIGSETVMTMHEFGSGGESRGRTDGTDGDGGAGSGEISGRNQRRPGGSGYGGWQAQFARLGFGGGPSGEEAEEESDAERKERRVRELTSALTGLVSRVGSVTRTIRSWEEAREVLSEVLVLPDERGEGLLRGGAVELRQRRADDRVRPRRKARSLSVKKYAGMIQMARLESRRKWRQIRAMALPPARKELEASAAAVEARESPEVEVVDEPASSLKLPSPAAPVVALSPEERMDRLLEERIAETESIARAKEREEKERLDTAIAEREAREEAEADAEAEAQRRASSLLRSLTEEEQAIVRDAIYGVGSPDEILAKSDTDSVQRHSMHKLQPGVWLNDEVIHYFLLMLSRRDARLCEADPSRKRCHFFKSFFVSKLLDEAGYKYSNVKRWSKKVPGKDIFKLDKIFFPVNVNGMHWTSAVAFMQERRIQYYDSMHGMGLSYLEGLFQYIKDEHQAKKGSPLPDADKWELVPCTPDTPEQENGWDCGVFTCMFCDFISKGCPLAFSQEHVNQCRERIALSIMKGSAIE